MPERIDTMLDALQVGDYTEGQGGVIWKVTHEREADGQRHLGLTNAEGGRKIVAVSPGVSVVRLEYGTPMTEEAVVAELGQVLATHDGPNWFHPPFSAFYENEHMLRGHLIRFHGADVRGLEHDDLTDMHGDLHAAGADHDHGE